MQYFVVVLATFAGATAAPGYLLSHEPGHLPLAKSTFTSSLDDSRSTHLIHSLPVVHSATLVHIPMSISTQSHERTSYHAPASKTVTSSNQVVNHGGTAVYHSPVVHSPVAFHSSPIVYHSSPLVAFNTPASFGPHSTTVHETVPVLNSSPL